ncbi:MAG TPA: Ig-like domain repeat protein [Terracidiphilus sp.]
MPSVVASGQAKFVDKLPTTQRIEMTIVLPVRNQAELTNLLRDLYDPASPEYRRFLTVQEFTNQFGPTEQDYDGVIRWAKSQDLTVRRESKNRMVLDVSGTVAQANAALNVSMNLYHDADRKRDFYSIDREPTLPLTARIAHIEGLNNYSVPRPMIKLAKKAGTVANVTGSGPGGYYLGSDMRAAYYGGTLLTGTGQSVGIFEFGGYRLSDVNLTFNNAGQSYSVPINNVLIDGASTEAGSDDSEQVLDIVQAIGMAPGLSQVRVYIGNSGYDADIFNSMATEDICKQISVSWGWSPDDPSTDDSIFQEFAAQGQSIFVASGDDGAYDATISPYFYPAEDDYVTAVGGTHLTTNYGGGPWVAESAWNNPPSGSGGGVSPDSILIPSWQQGVATYNNGGSTYLRNVPDVAMEADIDNYYCYMGTCSGGAGGTSFAAPRWAGLMALINEQATETGNAPTGGLGSINPTIYSIGEGSNYNSEFHDVATGNNDSDNQPVWYSAVTGYDLVTGWGSPNGQSLIDALAGPVVSGFWLSSLPGDVPVAQNSSGATNVAVTDAGGFSGNVSLAASGLPSGVTASFNPTSTASTSVLTVTAASSASVRTTPITITGTSGSLTSKTSLFVTVNPPSLQPPPADQFPATNIGSTGSPMVLNVTFTTAGTLETIGVLTQGVANLDFANAGGGTCTVGTAYASNAICTVNVSFTPKLAGARYGAVVLSDANGNPLGKVYLDGTGVGPQATFNPGTQSTIGNGFLYPVAVAPMGDDSVYVSDYGSGNGTGGLYFERFSNDTYMQSRVSCTLISPVGVAVDGAGTLYVADPGVPAVYKVTILPNGTCNQSAIGSGFGTPWGVAVDGNGDVYVTDLGTSTLVAAVYKETLQANGSYQQSTVGAGWIGPAAIAVDSKGNVDVADGGIAGVFKETPAGGGYTQSPIGDGWTSPAGIAVDGSGNIYVADVGNSIVYGGTVPASLFREVPSGDSYTRSAIGTGWAIPGAIGVDGGGNIYVSDQTRGVFKEDLADPPVLTFANTATGTVSSDSPKTETISNLGSTALQFSSLGYPIDFPEVTGTSTDCTASTTLAVGASCTLSIEFLPTTSLGLNTSLTLNESVGLTTNTLNTNTQQGIALGATEVLPGGSVALSVSADPASVGTTVTLTATVKGSNGGPTPTGNVTFLSGANPISGPLTLSNGVASFSTSSLPIGAYSMIASYSGDQNYLASNSNTILESILPAAGVSGFGNTSIGNQNIGSTSSVIPMSILFSSAETLGSISVLTEGAPNLDFALAAGGTCMVGTAYVANSSCSVNLTFSPKYPGARFGAVVLADNNQNVIGTGYLEGIGVGPETSFTPGTLNATVSGFSFSEGVAVDGSQNLYVTDVGNAAVYKETFSNGSYSQSSVAGGFNQPYSVAIDGAGNIYVADVGNHAVYKETPANGAYLQTLVGYGFVTPRGVAVDALGNVYVADFGNAGAAGAVYLETLSNGSYAQSAIGSGLISPQSVAVDGSGNVYVADSANGNGIPALYKLTPTAGTYTQTTIGSSWITPSGVAIDGVGNVYITDDAYDIGDGFVVKETLESDGSYGESVLLGSTETPYPGGVAVDWIGNLYVADNLDGTVYRDDIVDPPALSFATTVSKSMSNDSPQTIVVQNDGNASLNFSALVYPADFPESPGVTTDCTSSTSLVAGAACSLSIDFNPASLSGTAQSTLLSEDVTLKTNSLNLAPSTLAVPVSGTEIAPLAAVTLSAPANVATVGTVVTLTANVHGQTGITAPTGTVTFFANGTTLGTVPLNGGLASYSTSSLALGTALIAASYSGDQNYPSAASNILSISVISSSTFGTENIGTSATDTITVQFAAKVTLGSISVITQGISNLDFTNAGSGTCAAGKAYAANATCTVVVAFRPRFAGPRFGALVLIDNRGNLIQTIYLEGTGVGPQLSYQPAVPSTINSSLTDVGGIAADENGDIYVISGTNLSGSITKFTVSGNSYTSTTIPSSLHYASGAIAVDGSGAVYASDLFISSKMWNCRMVKETLVGSTYKESVIGPTLQNCTQTLLPAVDGAGNVYIGEEGTSTLWKETPSLAGTYTQTTLQIPAGVYIDSLAVDGSGNLYISSWNNGSTLVQVLAGGGTTDTVIATTPDVLSGIAIGAFGDLYTVDINAQSPVYSLLKFTPSSGGYAQSTVIAPMAFQQSNPLEPLAVDGSENVYTAMPNSSNGITDNYLLDKTGFGTPPSLSFAVTNVGSTSSDSPKTITLNNIGNAALTLAVPGSGTNPTISSNFSFDNRNTSCPQVNAGGQAGTLIPNNACTYAVDFTPTITGTISGSVVLTDNALNAVGGTQTIPLSGTGNSQTQMAILTVGPSGAQQIRWIPAGVSPSNPTIDGSWVDTYNQIFIVGLAEFETGTCNEINPGNLSVQKDVLGGKWLIPTDPMRTFVLPQCPGHLYPFSTAYYTWNSTDQVDLQDPFILHWTTPDGQFNETVTSNAEFDHVGVSQAVPNSSGQNPPLTAEGSLTTTPTNASNYTWIITGGGGAVVFANRAETIQSTNNSIPLMEPNPSANGTTFNLETDVQTSAGTLRYGPTPAVFNDKLTLESSKPLWWFGKDFGGNIIAPDQNSFKSGDVKTTITAQNASTGNFVWTITNGTSTVSFSQDSAQATTTTTSNTVTLYSIGRSSKENDVTVSLAYTPPGGQMQQAALKLTVDWPYQLVPNKDTTTNKPIDKTARCWAGSTAGYRSTVGYFVESKFGVTMVGIPVNEFFTGSDSPTAPYTQDTENWDLYALIQTQQAHNTDQEGFFDDICISNSNGKLMPAPQPPPSPPNALSTTGVDSRAQEWHVGSDSSKDGPLVQTDTLQRYLDHGAHLDIKSPPANN